MAQNKTGQLCAHCKPYHSLCALTVRFRPCGGGGLFFGGGGWGAVSTYKCHSTPNRGKEKVIHIREKYQHDAPLSR